MNNQISFLEQIYKASPPVFALVVFIIAVITLNKVGLLSFKDSTEDAWRTRVQGDLDEIRERVDDLKTKVAVLTDRWDRK